MTLRDRIWLWWHGYCTKHVIERRWEMGAMATVCPKCWPEQRDRHIKKILRRSNARNRRLKSIRLRAGRQG